MSYNELLDLTATLSNTTFPETSSWTIADINTFDWVMDGSGGTSIYLSNSDWEYFEVYDNSVYMDIYTNQSEDWSGLTGEKQEDGSWNYSEGSFFSDPVYIASGAEPEILAGVEPEVTAKVPEPSTLFGLGLFGVLGSAIAKKKRNSSINS